MTRFLQFNIVCFCMFVSSALFAQEKTQELIDPLHHHSDHHELSESHEHASCETSHAITEFVVQEFNLTAIRTSSLTSLEVIITSDEAADLNCSGGFCMIKSHLHKKGLTNNRQLFDYFVRISG